LTKKGKYPSYKIAQINRFERFFEVFPPLAEAFGVNSCAKKCRIRFAEIHNAI
jgi:hypothetical protein